MQEKILKNKRNGMAVLALIILIYIAGIIGCIYSADKMETDTLHSAIFIASMVVLGLGWFPAVGLKVLKPQEALVLTLFGKYYGTLKGEGFYFVNPFCVSVNPAAKTKLNQSGDVSSNHSAVASMLKVNVPGDMRSSANKISLKIMTLNNNRQKINDFYGVA